MLNNNLQLKKLSDSIFIEVKDHAEQSNPMEWRRSFKHIILPLRNIKIGKTFALHDTDIDLEEEGSSNPFTLIKCNIENMVELNGTVDIEKVGDSLLFAMKNSDDNNIFSVEQSAGNIFVSIRSGKPSINNGKIPAGIYPGSAMRTTCYSRNDDIKIDLRMPEEQLLTLISEIKSSVNFNIEVEVSLLSFTSEIDEAFLEPYDSRNIIITEHATCFLSSVCVVSKL